MDGVEQVATEHAGAFTPAWLSSGDLLVEADDGGWSWDLNIRNEVSVDACAAEHILLQTKNVFPAHGFDSLATGGACNVQVTRAAPNVGDVIEGIFSAVLPELSGTTRKVVTNGRFRVHRIVPPM